jgi:hypothetical protein
MEIDPPRILRASKIRFGMLRAQGVPAILLGVAGIILAAGAARVMRDPEALRETRALLDATRRDVRPLKP